MTHQPSEQQPKPLLAQYRNMVLCIVAVCVGIYVAPWGFINPGALGWLTFFFSAVSFFSGAGFAVYFFVFDDRFIPKEKLLWWMITCIILTSLALNDLLGKLRFCC